jgi:spermidine/putrescine transport system permease protein
MARNFNGLLFYALLLLAYIYGPVLLMATFSFNDNTFAVFPLKGFTLKAYGQMAANQAIHLALRNSLGVGVFVAIVSTTLGLLAAMAVLRYRLPGRGPIVGTILLPLVVPSIVLAVALLVVIRLVLDIDLSLWTVGAGHVMLCVPFSMMILASRLEGFDRSLEEASLDLGESRWMTFWRVTLPLALPGIAASLLMSFSVSFDEFVIAFFLSGTDQTLPVLLYSQLRFPQRLPGTLALGTSILAASIVLTVIAELLRRKGTRAQSQAGI